MHSLRNKAFHAMQLRSSDPSVLIQLAEAARPGLPTLAAGDLVALVAVRI